MPRHRLHTCLIALVFLAANLSVSASLYAQSVVPGAPASSKGSLRVLVAHATATPSTDVSGHWRGNLGSPNDPSGADWLEEIDFHQNTDGSITGTRRTVPVQNTANWVTWSITGSLSGTTLTFQDQAILGQGNTSMTPCPVDITADVTAGGNGFSGSWTSMHSGCAGGSISAAKDAVDSGKNMADGARCDAGEGSPFGRNNSNTGGASDGGGATCPSLNGSPNVGDPINASTGNYYLQQDDYTATPWLTFRRFYNSDEAMAPAYMGAHWRHSFDRSLQIFGSPASTIVMFRPDGKQETFKKSGGVWTTELDVDQLTEVDDAQGALTGYAVFIGASRHNEIYDTAGKLISVIGEDGQGIMLTYSTASTPWSTAPQAGLLIAVQDPQGRELQIDYDSNARIHQVTLPDGHWLRYSYNLITGNLNSVTYPDGETRGYLYNESAQTGGANLPNALTGITDENGVRYETVSYDSSGRATAAAFAGNVGGTHITYNSDGTSAITFPLGYATTMGFTTADDLVRVGTIDHPCGPDCGQPWQARSYDSHGYPASYTDFDGVLTKVTYDTRGLLHEQIEAAGTSDQRTTETTWDINLRVPLARTVRDSTGAVVASTAWVYSSQGKIVARCEIDPASSAAAGYACSATGTVPAGVRRWTYTYCTAVDNTQCPVIGLLLTATGPRTDLTQTVTYAYYLTDSATAKHGDLKSVTDALGHVTTVASYDGAGRITRTIDPNSSVTDYTYTPRGWLATRTVRFNPDGSANMYGDAITTLTYTAYGAVQTITDADGVKTTYGYDDAHRLNSITDALGNSIQYTLDASGNRIAEKTFAAGSSTPSRTLTRTFNKLGQLTQVVDGLNHTVFDASASGSYDGNGNLLQSSDANGIVHWQSYDALNRLVQRIDNLNGTDAATRNTTTTQNWDALNRLTQVTDPSHLATTYGYDGLGNPISQSSPDSGTSYASFDAAGNLLSHTDANGITVSHTYDALDRRLSDSYADGTLNASYYYDDPESVVSCNAVSSPSNPIGHLTRIVESAVTTTWCYDRNDHVAQQTQLTAGHTDATELVFSGAGRLEGRITPDGFSAFYGYDSAGRVTTVIIPPGGVMGSGGQPVQNITYLPFGPMTSYQLNGQTISRSYDANYALTDITSAALNLHFARDPMGNIIAEGNTPGANPAVESYGYDPLNQLKMITRGSTVIGSLTYNPTGDRLSKAGSGLATGAYGYDAGTHHLSSIGNTARTYDANGNTTGASSAGQAWGYGYNGRNRLTVVQAGGSTVGTYVYNALGQRIQKTTTVPTAMTQRFFYDEQSHLIGEYTEGGTNRDTIWLGDMPVATVDTGGTTSVVNYVIGDQLGTPRVVLDGSGNTIWSWPSIGNAFGELAPTSTTGYVLNLRYPGQYYDAESGLMYNGARYYDSAAGRFEQSDPLGLFGGQASTYAYVGGNPLNRTDPTGLRCNGQGCWNTPQESAYAAAGDWKNYYATACAGGDTYACEGSNVANNVGTLSGITNYRLASLISDHLPPGKTCAADSAIIAQKMEAIREALVAARVRQLTGATPDNPMIVGEKSIADFHNAIFRQIAGGSTSSWGIPVFGGDLPFSNKMVHWCTSPACHP